MVTFRFSIRQTVVPSPTLTFMTMTFVAALAAPFEALSQDETADLVLGSWSLDLEASKFSPGPPPKSQTRTYASTPDGIEVTIETVDADGRTLSAEYVAHYDSLEYPITGSNTVNAISLKQIDAHTAEATLRHARKVIGTARRIIAEDGNTMTITYHGANPGGEPVEITAVYDRKPE